MHDIEGFTDVFGGSIPALIWHDFMTTAMEGQPVETFAQPSFKGYDLRPSGAISPTPAPSPSPSPTPPSPSPTLPPTPPPPTPTLPTPPPTPTPTLSESPSASPPPRP